MPIYGYRCSNCGHEFEIQQKMTDHPLQACPKCQGKLTKILYPIGISFKGSGFYTTDYKGSENTSGADSSDGAGKGSDRAAAQGSSEIKAESKSESESRSESKPESKPDKKSTSKSDSKTEKKAS